MKLKVTEKGRNYCDLEIGTVFQIPDCPTLFIKIFVGENNGTYAMNLESGTTLPISNSRSVIPFGKLSREVAMKLIKIKQAKHFGNLAPGDVFQIANDCAVYMKIAADNRNVVNLEDGTTAGMADQIPITPIPGVFEEDNGYPEEK